MSIKTIARQLLRPRRLFWVLTPVLLAVGGFIGYYQYHFRAAQTAFDRDQFDAAKNHIDKCLAVWPRSVAAHLLAARIDRFMGQFLRAEHHLVEANRLDNGNSEALQIEWGLLSAHERISDQTEGALFDYVARQGAESAMVLKTLSAIYMREIQADRAHFYLGKWIEVEPKRDTPYFWRGLVHYRQEHFGDAINDFLRALERNPDNHLARLRLVDTYIQGNQNDKLAEHLNYLAEHDGRNVEVRIALGRFHALEGEYDQARQILDGVLAEKPQNGKALYVRGYVERLAEQPDKEEPFLRRATELKPPEPEALFAEFECLTKLNRPSEAKAFFERYEAIRRDMKRIHELEPKWQGSGGNADVSADIGEIYLRWGATQRGLQWLYRGLLKQSDHQRTNQLLLDYYEGLGDTAKAAMHRARLQK